jgi:mRNA interferase YafQ
VRRIEIRPLFSADWKRLKRRQRIDRETWLYVLGEIEAGQPIPPSLNPHALKDEWAGWSEFHLDADLLVVYRLTEDAAVFYRLGTHAELFQKRPL